MRLLLDTHVLLWAAGEPDKLSGAGKNLLLNHDNSLYFSPANIWEIVIKRRLGRDDFQVDPARLRKLLVLNGYSEVPIIADHALMLESLPQIHKDPFDRLLLAQARSEGMQLVSSDSQLFRYGDGVIRI